MSEQIYNFFLGMGVTATALLCGFVMWKAFCRVVNAVMKEKFKSIHSRLGDLGMSVGANKASWDIFRRELIEVQKQLHELKFPAQNTKGRKK